MGSLLPSCYPNEPNEQPRTWTTQGKGEEQGRFYWIFVALDVCSSGYSKIPNPGAVSSNLAGGNYFSCTYPGFTQVDPEPYNQIPAIFPPRRRVRELVVETILKKKWAMLKGLKSSRFAKLQFLKELKEARDAGRINENSKLIGEVQRSLRHE